MCDFNNLDEAEKVAVHEALLACANSFGGKNFFLQLLEAVRAAKPHPLMAKECEFRLPIGTIKWNKAIFLDKLTLLSKERVHESKRGNFLPKKDEKGYKSALNLVKTLSPIEFAVRRKNKSDGEGFTMRIFDPIDEETVRLSPIFDALFFCAIETVKKALSYTPKVKKIEI